MLNGSSDYGQPVHVSGTSRSSHRRTYSLPDFDGIVRAWGFRAGQLDLDPAGLTPPGPLKHRSTTVRVARR